MTADDARARAIEAGARAINEWTCAPVWLRPDARAAIAAAVLDAVEPIIRADEDRRASAVYIIDRDAIERECLADLRAKVDGLRVVESRVKGRRINVLVDRAAVLALLDEVQT